MKAIARGPGGAQELCVFPRSQASVLYGRKSELSALATNGRRTFFFSSCEFQQKSEDVAPSGFSLAGHLWSSWLAALRSHTWGEGAHSGGSL